MKKILSLLLVILLLLATAFSVAACSEKEPEQSAASTIAFWQRAYTAGEFGIRSKRNPFVEFTLNSGETIRVELYPSVAPISVENFITYVKEGFYDGVAFHRIIESAMIQTGGFEFQTDLFAHKAATHEPIKGEFRANGYNNTLSHTKGVISMARTDDYDSATSQFFICANISESYTTSYDGNYAAFGRVIDEESMTVVSRLEKLPTHTDNLYYDEYPSSQSDVPIAHITIKKASLVWDK